MFKFSFTRLLTCSFFIVGSLCSFAFLNEANSLELTSMPKGSYQLARTVFLPDAGDEIWLPGNGGFGSNYNKDACDKMGYRIKGLCPDYGNCSACPLDKNSLKLNSCNSTSSQKYKVSSDGLSCERYCDVKTCNTSTYYMTTCPEGMDCSDRCTEIQSNCQQILHFKPTTKCISGYHYSGGRCVKDCAEVKCGPGYGIYKEWKDQCAEGYLCTKRSNDYQTTDCKTGSCYQYKGCDEAKGYFKPSWSSGGECQLAKCLNTATNCSGFPLTSCPTNGVCANCTVTNKFCDTDGTKYRLDGCVSGYHLNYEKTACVKDCVVDDEVSSYDLVFATPKFNTNAECIASTGVATCELRSFYTSTTCAYATKYIPKTCESGYKFKQTSSAYKGGTLLTFNCEKACTVKTCSNYKLTTCPTHAHCSTCVETDNTCASKTKYQISDCDNGYVPNNLEDPYLLNDENANIDLDFSQTTSCTKFFKACDTVGDIMYLPNNKNDEPMCALDPTRPIKAFTPFAVVIHPNLREAVAWTTSSDVTFEEAENYARSINPGNYTVGLPTRAQLETIGDYIEIMDQRFIAITGDPLEKFYTYWSNWGDVDNTSTLVYWTYDLKTKQWSQKNPSLNSHAVYTFSY